MGSAYSILHATHFLGFQLTFWDFKKTNSLYTNNNDAFHAIASSLACDSLHACKVHLFYVGLPHPGFLSTAALGICVNNE